MRVLLVLIAAGAVQAPALRPQTATDIHLFGMRDRGLAGLATAAPEPLATEPGYENQPSFDPEGRYVLFTANRDGKQTDIYEFDRTSKVTRQLTRTPEGEYSPVVPAVRPAPGPLARDGFTVIRLELDGTQRLWQFDRQGRDPIVVLPGINPAGYYAWIDADRLALYVLGQPPTLRMVRVSTGRADTLARDVGRTLRVIPDGTRATVSFIQREAEDQYWIMALDPSTGRVDRLTATVPGSFDRDYEWMPDGQTLLMSAGTQVLAWSRGAEGWREVLDVSKHGFGPVTRLAVSPAGDALAVVVAEPPKP